MHGRAPSTVISPSPDEGDCQATNAASRLAAVGYRIEIAVSALDRNYKRSIRLPLTRRCYQRGSSNEHLVSQPPAVMRARDARKNTMPEHGKSAGARRLWAHGGQPEARYCAAGGVLRCKAKWHRFICWVYVR